MVSTSLKDLEIYPGGLCSFATESKYSKAGAWNEVRLTMTL